MIERESGALVLPEGRVERGLTRSEFVASPLGRKSIPNDMRTGWVHFDLASTMNGRQWAVRVSFDGERLDGYALCLADSRYGTSWDDWSEAKQIALRDAHDEWLTSLLGEGKRVERPYGTELTYELSWGGVWSSYDPRSASSTIGVRFKR